MAASDSQIVHTLSDPERAAFVLILEDCKLSDRIEIELSTRERLLCAMNTAFEDTQDMIVAVKDYVKACQTYSERLGQIKDWNFYNLCPRGAILPLSHPLVLPLVLRYSSGPGLLEPDCFGRNTLQAALETCQKRDIETFISQMDVAKFIEMARHRCTMKWSIFHISAMRGIDCIFAMTRELSFETFVSMLDAKDAQSKTPLFYGLKNKSSATARILLNFLANPRILNGLQRNAMHHAVIEKHQDIVTLLIRSYADLRNTFDVYGYTPFHLAIHEGNLEIAQLFPPDEMRVISANARDPPLSIASSNGHISIMRWLLDEGVDINYRNPYGDTALKLAAHEGKLEAVKLLVSKGAKVNVPDICGTTARDAAQQRGKLDVVFYLDGIAGLH